MFNRVWDTPDNGYAEKFKHSIEPVLTIRPYLVGRQLSTGSSSSTASTASSAARRCTYGLNNRFYAKRKTAPGAPAQAREIFDVELSQSYYTESARRRSYDPQYQTSSGLRGAEPTNFSPIALSVRAMPTDDVNATLRAEFDAAITAAHDLGAGLATRGPPRAGDRGWSKRGYIAQMPGFNDCRIQSFGATGFARSGDQRHVTCTRRTTSSARRYSFNYDVLPQHMLQQRMSAFYNAQCCGLAFEYQTYNFGAASSSPIPADHRFFMSFTLAGLGNFSPFNGALSGVPR